MKIYVSEEHKNKVFYLTTFLGEINGYAEGEIVGFDLLIKNADNITHSRPDFVFDNEKDCINILDKIAYKIPNKCNFELYSLEQHDDKIRNQERAKVIEEIENFVDLLMPYSSDNVTGLFIDKNKLQQKLKEMKGE